MSKDISFKSLRKFNGIMGVLHLLQGFLMLGFALFIDKISSFEIPVRSYFLTFDQTQMRLVTDMKEQFNVPFGIVSLYYRFSMGKSHLQQRFEQRHQPF